MGLGDHVINGLYCTLQNPPVDKEELIEELWNGNDKIYTKQPNIFVGIIEPFLEDSVSADPLLSYSKMLLVALAIGLRDGKPDGLKDGTLIDVDDCYTSVTDPIFQSIKELKEKGIAPIDLPFLKDPLASMVLSQAQIATLAEIAEAWDIFSICTMLGQEPILYADSFAEGQKPGKPVMDASTGSSFTVDTAEENLMHPDTDTVDIKKRKTILNEDQKVAIATRMNRLKKFIREQQRTGEQFTPLALVYAVDPFSRLYADAIESLGRESIRGATPIEFTGRSTPNSLAGSFRWDSKDLEELASGILQKSASQQQPKVDEAKEAAVESGEVERGRKVSAAASDAEEVEIEAEVYASEEEESETDASVSGSGSGSEVDEGDDNELSALAKPSRRNSDNSDCGFDFG